MTCALVLALSIAVAPVPAALSAEAGEYNAKAMQFYDNRQLEPAFEQFQVAYNVMPDPRRDRAGRELLLGSMRATLLELHEANGEPAPLCRLQTVLQKHAEALSAAYPEDPNMLELRSARARHDEVTKQLAAMGPDVCAAPPASVSVKPEPTPTPAKAVTKPAPASALPAPVDEPIPQSHLRIAGGIPLALGAVLLSVMTYGIIVEVRRKAKANAIDDSAADRPLTELEHRQLLGYRRDALSARYLAIGTGVAAGVTGALGTTLLVLARHSTRTRRLTFTPWWSRTGAGMTLSVRLGAAR